MFTIGNDELEDAPTLGSSIRCPHCGETHTVEFGDEILENGEQVKSLTLAFYRCGKTQQTYLAGINGKSLMERSRE